MYGTRGEYRPDTPGAVGVTVSGPAQDRQPKEDR